MFNALSSIGAGLPAWDQATNSLSSAILMWIFAVFSIVAPSIVTMLGVRVSAFIGASGYLLYTLALHNYSDYDAQFGAVSGNSTAKILFLAASAFLGVSGSIMWTTQGAMIMAYPTEKDSGKMLAMFWVIFNTGALGGSAWNFAENYSNPGDGVSATTYIGFMVVMGFGLLLALFLCSANNVVRTDGTFCQLQAARSIRSECEGILKTFTDKKMLLLTPLIMYSNWCYTYQFAIFNVEIFNVRSRSYTSLFYWGAQMLGATVLGRVLDCQTSSLHTRAKRTLGFVVFLGGLSWGLCFYIQGSVLPNARKQNGYDFMSSDSVLPAALYTCFGLLDAIVQCWIYWLMSNLGAKGGGDSTVLVRYAGYYKTLQNVGAGIAAELNGARVDPMIQLLVNVILFAVAIIPSYIAINLLEVDSRDIIGNVPNSSEEPSASAKEPSATAGRG